MVLAGISIHMMIGMGYHWYNICKDNGFDLCMNLHAKNVQNINISSNAAIELWSGASGYYMWMFAISKYYEFIDTFIMMAKSYDIIFLHWWHHATVPILMCIHAIEHSSSVWTGSWFNCFVHTVMYSYCLSSIGFSLLSIKSLITTLQLIQFITVLGHVGYLHYINGWDCHPYTFTFAYTVYGSYLVLFINFFLQQYVFKKNKTKTIYKKK